MAVTQRGRRTAYDNIASGSATGKERTVNGDAGVTELYGGGAGTGSTDSVGRNNLTPGTSDHNPDNIPSQSSFSGTNGAVDNTNTTGPTDERLG